MNDEETMNDLLRTLNDHLGDIHTELIGIREACEKANKEQMKSEEFAMGMVGGITETLRDIALEAEGKKLVELVEEEDGKLVECCPVCSNYAVSEKGDKHMCRRSEPEGRYIPGSFIMESTIPDWCPLALGTKEIEEEVGPGEEFTECFVKDCKSKPEYFLVAGDVSYPICERHRCLDLLGGTQTRKILETEEELNNAKEKETKGSNENETHSANQGLAN